ncbi:hypothetical protein D7X96_15935 [Corallococcus interemptor]|uniref:Uncharacterized protein n=2 Tax=Corallococcus interemptor TaxID=2316720 RepID=A0A3A8QJY1_9BACT|nr:hypothetical protein D7X96_15935 [Corallococcus interemptor]
MPDIIEPAIHSHHRSTFHSLTTASAVTYGALQKKVDLPAMLRNEAALVHQRVAATQANGNSAFLDQLLELFLHFLAGAAAGTAAGYVSHLACDATTPRSIPLFTRGF